MKVYCIQSGNTVEFGDLLYSIHATKDSAYQEALTLIAKKEESWGVEPDDPDYLEWTFKSIAPRDEEEVFVWECGHNIIMVTVHDVR